MKSEVNFQRIPVSPMAVLRPGRDVRFRILRLLSWSCGIFLLFWAFRDPRFRDAEGFLNGKFCLPLAASMALLILGTTVTTALRRSASWFALAIVGQAVALQLINAGSHVRYQHYTPFSQLAETHSLMLIIVAIQTVLVVAGLKSHWSAIRVWIGRSFKIWQLLAIALVFFLSSATVSREVRVYLAELSFATFVQAVNLANVVLIVFALPTEALGWLKTRFDALLGDNKKELSGERKGLDAVAISAAVWVLAVAATLSLFPYERHPHIADEVVYLYHARYFAGGMLTMPAPPVPAGFDIDLMNYETTRWYCPVPPGWPAVLALGVLLGVPWMVNPVLAGLNVLLVYLLMRELFDRRAARFVVLLLCVSPWYLFMGMNFMTHMLTLTCALVAALAVSKSRNTNRAMWALVGGMAAGFITLIRPLDGLIAGGVIGLWVIGVGGRRLKTTSIVGFVFGCVLVGAIQLPYNKMLTGSPLKFPLNAYNDKYHGNNSIAYGFGPDRGMGWEIDPNPGHSPIDALINADLNTFSINIELFGWSTGSLLLVALMLFSGTLKRSDYLMIAVLAAVFIAYFFFFFSGGPEFGARYWFLMLVPCVALTVSGIRFLQRKFDDGPTAFPVVGSEVYAAVLLLGAITLVNYFPWRSLDKYHNFLGMRPGVRFLTKQYGFGRSLVLIRGKRYPDYMSAATYNPLDLKADAPVYAWDRSPEVRKQLLEAYPDRPVWVVDGPSITHADYRVVEGPLAASELVAEKHAARPTVPLRGSAGSQ